MASCNICDDEITEAGVHYPFLLRPLSYAQRWRWTNGDLHVPLVAPLCTNWLEQIAYSYIGNYEKNPFLFMYAVISKCISCAFFNRLSTDFQSIFNYQSIEVHSKCKTIVYVPI